MALRGKSCLTNVATFYDRATALEDGARAADTIHLDSSKVFGTVLHDILVSKLERHGFDGWAALWIKNWLDGCTQSCCQGSIWTPVMRVFQLGLILFNTFISNMDSGIECEFALDTKLCGVVNMLERREVLQTDLDTLEKWEHANLVKLTKCKALHLGRGNPRHTKRLGEKVIESSPVEKDLGVMADEKLSVSQWCELTVQQTSEILGCIKRSVTSRFREGILPL
ncbi:RNA-directed DNA polymerase from mobile element jockey-like protein [Turdus rufiventris]|nr:RNA-directed DNA polymerase from mobile element jockey-like protein [Turdus rufiventris]